jgi:hypothetical protein
MSWLQQLGGLLQQYAGASPQQAPASADSDFSQFAQAAPPDALAQGIAHAFRSDQTPPFASMVGQLFGQSSPDQQAGLLNTLIAAAGPSVLQQVMGGGLGGLLGGGQVSPQQAAQVHPDVVGQLAGYAEQQNPSIIDQLGGFVAQNPGMFQTLGAGALTAALAGMANRQQPSGSYPGGVAPASQDPYGDPADAYGGQQVLDASQDPYGDPADQMIRPASQDPYGDPADQR